MLRKVNYITGSFLHCIVSRDLVECITAVDSRLADFGAGVCEAEFEHEPSEWHLIVGVRLTHLLRVVDLPDDGFPTNPMSGSLITVDELNILGPRSFWGGKCRTLLDLLARLIGLHQVLRSIGLS